MIKKLQTIQNKALSIATGCTQDTNTQYLHDEINVLEMGTHLELYVTQLKELTHTHRHPLHCINAHIQIHTESRNLSLTITMITLNIIISGLDITLD